MGYFFFFFASDEENDSFHLDKMERQVRISCFIHSFSFPPSPPTPPSFSLSLCLKSHYGCCLISCKSSKNATWLTVLRP